MIPFSEFPLLRTVVNAAVSRLRSAGLPEGAAGDDFGRLAFLSFFRDRSYDPLTLSASSSAFQDLMQEVEVVERIHREAFSASQEAGQPETSVSGEGPSFLDDQDADPEEDDAESATPRSSAKRPASGAPASSALLPKIPRRDGASTAAVVERAVSSVALDATGVKVLPQFLANKPLDVTLYTPELIKMFRASHAASATISTLGDMLYGFEGDYLSLSSEDAARAPPSPLARSVPPVYRARIGAQIEKCRSAHTVLRDATNRTQRIFWLGNHTTNCDWSTVDQLIFREEHDAYAADIDPSFVPLATWDDQVKAAMVGAKQDKLGLTKDGKSLVGPICPRLLAQQGRNRGDGFGRGGSHHNGGDRAGRGGGHGPSGSPYGQWRTDSFGSGRKGGRGDHRRGAGRGGGRGRGRENKAPKSGSPPAPGSGAAAAAQP